jgi:hypothetical protein
MQLFIEVSSIEDERKVERELLLKLDDNSERVILNAFCVQFKELRLCKI